MLDLIGFGPLEVLICLHELFGAGEVFLAKNAINLKIGTIRQMIHCSKARRSLSLKFCVATTKESKLGSLIPVHGVHNLVYFSDISPLVASSGMISPSGSLKVSI